MYTSSTELTPHQNREWQALPQCSERQKLVFDDTATSFYEVIDWMKTTMHAVAAVAFFCFRVTWLCW